MKTDTGRRDHKLGCLVTTILNAYYYREERLPTVEKTTTRPVPNGAGLDLRCNTG